MNASLAPRASSGFADHPGLHIGVLAVALLFGLTAYLARGHQRGGRR